MPLHQRLDSLEGLRFLSSIVIVAGHFIPYVVATPLIARLHLAVDLFFVISGIVIAERYAGPIASGTPWLAAQGELTYSIYLLHTVVATVVLGVAAPNLLGTGLPARLAGLLVALAVLYGLAQFSLRYFERLLRRRINAAADATLQPHLRHGLQP